MSDKERFWEIWLRRLMFLSGGFLLLATFAIFLPVSAMAKAHAFLGLGEFPDAPITIYLARSTSVLYALHGAVTVFVAWRWDPLKVMVPFLGFLHILLGLTMLGIDLTTPMPAYWTAVEGGPVAALGALIVWMSRKMSTADR